MSTPPLPAGKLNLNEVTETSLLALLVNFPDFFYYTVKDADESINTAAWRAVHPVRREVLKAYTELSKTGKIIIERSMFILPEVDHLPNIVELMMWWMGFMQMHGGSHGYRSFRTPSSTKLADGRAMCVAFVANEYLWIRPNIDTTKLVIEPDNCKPA